MWLAYHTALFQRVKELPDFKTLMSGPEAQKPQTAAQLERISRKLAAAGVGEFQEAEHT